MSRQCPSKESEEKTVEKPEEEIFKATTKATGKHFKWGAHYFKGSAIVESAVAFLAWCENGLTESILHST